MGQTKNPVNQTRRNWKELWLGFCLKLSWPSWFSVCKYNKTKITKHKTNATCVCTLRMILSPGPGCGWGPRPLTHKVCRFGQRLTDTAVLFQTSLCINEGTWFFAIPLRGIYHLCPLSGSPNYLNNLSKLMNESRPWRTCPVCYATHATNMTGRHLLGISAQQNALNSTLSCHSTLLCWCCSSLVRNCGTPETHRSPIRNKGVLRNHCASNDSMCLSYTWKRAMMWMGKWQDSFMTDR